MEQFKNKFIFYSPKIRHSIDFSICDAQDVFIYIKGRSLDPMGIFQQTTRTRNIDTLYYYSHVESYEPKFESLDHVKDHYSEIENASRQINDICNIIDENDNEAILKNNFFNIYCNNEYINDCYRTNKLKHFENILIENGFDLTSSGFLQKISKDADKEMSNQLILNKDELFDDYIQSNNRNHEQFNIINENISTLQLNNVSDEKLIIYKNIILDKYEIQKNFNFDRLQKTDEYVNKKLLQIEKENFSFKCYNSTYHKKKINA